MADLGRLLKHKRKRRKLWQETTDPVCKTAVNWDTRNLRRMAGKEFLKDGKQSWQTSKSHLKQYGLLRNPPYEGVDQRHHMQLMVT
jgi:hypothetical protein